MTTPECEKFEKFWADWENQHAFMPMSAYEKGLARSAWQAALSAAPAPPEVEPVAWELEMDGDIFTSYSKQHAQGMMNGGWILVQELYTSPPSPITPEVEPEGWLIEFMEGDWKTVKLCRHNAIGDYRATHPDATCTPLYPSPPSPKAEWSATGDS